MANVFTGDTWIIDTASATAFTLQTMKVKAVQVSSTGISPAGRTVITDADGVERMSMNGEFYALIENWWWDGSKVTVLEGGLLYINIY